MNEATKSCSQLITQEMMNRESLVPGVPVWFILHVMRRIDEELAKFEEEGAEAGARVSAGRWAQKSPLSCGPFR